MAGSVLFFTHLCTCLACARTTDMQVFEICFESTSHRWMAAGQSTSQNGEKKG